MKRKNKKLICIDKYPRAGYVCQSTVKKRWVLHMSAPPANSLDGSEYFDSDRIIQNKRRGLITTTPFRFKNKQEIPTEMSTSDTGIIMLFWRDI